MKKCMRGLALLLAVLMLMTGTVVAASIDNGKAVIKNPATGATVTFNETNSEKIDVVYTAENLTAGAQYLILMIKSDKEGNYTDIDENSILYIDQVAAVAGEGDAAPSVTFSAYPSAIKTSVILITGVEGAENGRIKAAIVEGKYILGDVTADEIVDVRDAMMTLQHSAGLIVLGDNVIDAGNVNGDTSVDVRDAMLILQFSAGLITQFPGAT